MSSFMPFVIFAIAFFSSNCLYCFSVPRDGRVYDNVMSHEHHFHDPDGHLHGPAESKKRLGEIVNKIDIDGNGYVTYEELTNWINKQQKTYIHDDVERQWKSHNPENKTLIIWEDYKKATYGFMDDLEDKHKNPSGLTNEDTKTYQDMMRRDRRRWQLADRDHDGSLSRDEFTDFLHPEEAPHMHSVVVEETLEDMDRDKDGKISLDEYINDMYSSDGNDGTVPDWVVREREQFRDYRDKNKDGFMDKEEIKLWILPPDYDHSEAEAKHLIHEADEDKDGQLSKDEIVNNYDVFVGSQATDFGEALVSHDEF